MALRKCSVVLPSKQRLNETALLASEPRRLYLQKMNFKTVKEVRLEDNGSKTDSYNPNLIRIFPTARKDNHPSLSTPEET